MFSTKSDIESWRNDFLEKNNAGEHICPFDKAPVKIFRARFGWRFEGRDEGWLWEVEDLKSRK